MIEMTITNVEKFSADKKDIEIQIDDELKTIVLKSIGDHSIYESMLDYWIEKELI